MKKVLVVAVAVAALVIAGAAFAGQAQNNTGCGLGTMLFKNSSNDSALLQAIQIVINYIPPLSIVPTVGITAGTAECQKAKNFADNERASEFMLANMDNVAKDIAQGRGESLDAFAEILGVPKEKRSELYMKLQSDFTRIYTSPDVQMASVMDNIATVSK